MKDQLIGEGVVNGVFIGSEQVRSVPAEKIYLDWDGIRGDRHYGRTKFAGVREKYLAKGTEMINLRQVSIVSTEELDQVAKLLEVDNIMPEDVSANITISGIPDFTKIPFGSIMQFELQANLLLTGDNFPCIIPGQEIEDRTGQKMAHLFAKQAVHKRGQTALILRPGIIKPGSRFQIILPKEVNTGLSYKI
ncbi:MOSC domain-containing protein [Candidatus Dojkabacteria bacterium]|uniref:MOSC domain-containing protein n=1 Tax=Candidatus Dojkabacteria bacterium TaxID=2099670 RepID=A0A955L5H8_9BACT|nr:MOSC domain-containing protein [Candidatus Dojkabacteria bacterium]